MPDTLRFLFLKLRLKMRSPNAAMALGRLGDLRAVEPLLRSLCTSNPCVRETAAHALGELADARAVEPLIRALRDSEGFVRLRASEALKKFENAQVVEPLIQTVKAYREGITRDEVRMLGSMGDRRAVEPLIGILGRCDEDLRNEAGIALGKLGDRRAVDPLIRALGDPAHGVWGSAIYALGRIGDPRAVEPVIQTLKSPERAIRQSAAEALGDLGDRRAVEPLIHALGDPEKWVRCRAADALCDLGEPIWKERVRGDDGDLLRLAGSGKAERGTKRCLMGHRKTKSVAFSLDGSRAVTLGYDHSERLYFWNLEDDCNIRFIKIGDWSATYGNFHVAIASDCRHCLSASGGFDEIQVWDLESGSETAKLPSQDVKREGVRRSAGNLCFVGFAGHGRTAIAGHDYAICLWDLGSNTCSRQFTGHSSYVRDVAVSPDGRLLVGATDAGTFLWDAATEAMLRTLVKEESSCVAFSCDGSFVAIGGWDGSISLWDVKNGSEIYRYRVHEDPVNALAISPDNKLALSGCGKGDAPFERTVCLFDLVEHKLLRRWDDHGASILAVTFSADGTLALSGARNGTVCIYDISKWLEDAAQTPLEAEPMPACAPRIRGGAQEPYCSDTCYDRAGAEIAGAILGQTSGTCAFCQSPVATNTSLAGSFKLFPYRGHWRFICRSCFKKGDDHVKGIKECCMCEKPL